MRVCVRVCLRAFVCSAYSLPREQLPSQRCHHLTEDYNSFVRSSVPRALCTCACEGDGNGEGEGDEEGGWAKGRQREAVGLKKD